jgi:hypothetical protein
VKHISTTFLIGMFALVAIAGSASAALRVPQVPVAGGTLQGYLNSRGEAINVLTDQVVAPSWTTGAANNSTFTLQIELSAFAAANNIGIYNASAVAPPLYQLFPGAAAAGWHAVASFRTAPVRVIVNLVDQNGVSQGTNIYLGADKTNFGFYLQGPGGLFFSEDTRNPGGNPQVLTYAGTGLNSGSWWVCLEDTPFLPGVSEFARAVLFCELVNPTPVSKTTWGTLKARFH